MSEKVAVPFRRRATDEIRGIRPIHRAATVFFGPPLILSPIEIVRESAASEKNARRFFRAFRHPQASRWRAGRAGVLGHKPPLAPTGTMNGGFLTACAPLTSPRNLGAGILSWPPGRPAQAPAAAPTIAEAQINGMPFDKTRVEADAANRRKIS